MTVLASPSACDRESAVSAGPQLKTEAKWRHFVNASIAAEISQFTRYMDSVHQYQPRPDDSGTLLRYIDCPLKGTANTPSDLAGMIAVPDSRSGILCNGNFNHNYDIQGLLESVKPRMNRYSRLIVVAYNPYLRWLYVSANLLGLRKGEIPTTFVTKTDVYNLCKLSGFECERVKPTGYSPFSLLGLGTLINRLFKVIPFVKNFSLAHVLVLRPVFSEDVSPKLSVVIPARNEKGNIENAVLRMPKLRGPVEILFVEGHSKDGTWEEIRRVQEMYGDSYDIKAFQQTGKGKNDAVRVGFDNASGDVLTILDADLTMPPEMLTRFYDAFCSGKGDFINGSRLVYPMEGDAMRFLNLLGNVFFAKALSYVLDARLGDSLCGTKLVAKRDYLRIKRWRDDFGDFDPFGDFELLFPAAILGLGIVNIPIRYAARTYGTTNINRFRHGLMLLKMTLIGFFRIKLR